MSLFDLPAHGPAPSSAVAHGRHRPVHRDTATTLALEYRCTRCAAAVVLVDGGQCAPCVDATLQTERDAGERWARWSLTTLIEEGERVRDWCWVSESDGGDAATLGGPRDPSAWFEYELTVKLPWVVRSLEYGLRYTDPATARLPHRWVQDWTYAAETEDGDPEPDWILVLDVDTVDTHGLL